VGTPRKRIHAWRSQCRVIGRRAQHREIAFSPRLPPSESL
jgi:hypothetical protein